MPEKILPDRTLENLCREAGAPVSCLWELTGPRNTNVAWICCYAIDRGLCIVETFFNGNWEALTAGSSNEIAATVADVLDRCGYIRPIV